MYSETRSHRIMASLWVMSGVACFFMSLRFYCKGRFGKRFGWDDLILAISWVLTALYAVFLSISAKYGVGSHFLEIPKENIYWLLFWLDHGLTCTILSVSLSKTSFAVTLLRFAPRPWQRYMIWFVIGSLNVIMTLVVVLQYAQCNPVQKRWNALLPGTCYDHHIIIYYSMFAGSYSALWDFVLATLPWFIIWKLQMNKKEKVGVALAMSLGILAGITAALKTSYLPGMGHWQDFTWESSNLLIWSGAEATMTIVGASIPFLRVLVKEVSSTHGNSYNLKNVSSGKGTGNMTRTGRPRDIQTYKRHHDDQSDRSILGEEQSKDGVIIRSNEVTVAYHERGDEESQRATIRTSVL
ncbi:uncharacterized protein BDR25DRAFT_208769 [Lindgomyces ingoldianus]|uniref:Uncharacterized protein n=1 Tax=Lindgomyces ingoldianus TaxID=673940 RepID=A0ACB6RC15_9PLEO|nr:uncharacterized protein BDR25DRAFT_208769 [Lindgomyces ingoldianus]KAF2476833.1 hypothetical protein BDR25DRAFT_208769 [Lindgomyces ingoldianus]